MLPTGSPYGGQMETEMTWDWWAGNLDSAPVSLAGKPVLSWAIGVLREFFGEEWLTGHAAQTGFVPLLNHIWWPLTNTRVIVQLLELAARIALVSPGEAESDLLQEARTIHPNRELAATKFQHLCLTLETAAFAVSNGWALAYEKTSISGRRPDLIMTRRDITYTVEVTTLGLDREFRAIDRYCGQLEFQLHAFEREHGIEISCRAAEVLDGEELSAWLDEIAHACQLTASDGAVRAVSHRDSQAEVFPDSQRPAGCVFTGPAITGDVWRRVGTRIAEKARQTIGSPAWLRIADTGALLRLTDRSAQPLQDLLADLQLNVDAALTAIPHVRGVVLSGAATIDPGNVREETSWAQDSGSPLIAPGPPRNVLANGPAAMSRKLPGSRSRLTFILPSPYAHLVLPSGMGLEPDLWYHDEPSWLTQALQALGKPPLDIIVRSS